MSTIIPRETLDRKVKTIQDKLLVMGSMVEHAALEAVEALNRRDFNLARRIYSGDQWINEKHLEIEDDCLTLIATQQPVSRDLRVLASALEVNTELERMGDYAKGIARILFLMEDQPPLPITFNHLSRMAELAVDMLHKALGAFVAVDADLASTLPGQDDQVDLLYNQFHRELIKMMTNDSSTIDRGNYLLWAAHNLERLADRVTNICERTLFIATGNLVELDVSDDELHTTV